MPLPSGKTVQYEDIVLLIGKDNKTFVRVVKEGQVFHTHFGAIACDALVGMNYGEQYKTPTGYQFFVLIPSFEDIIQHLHHEGQIIYPKDLGYIPLKLGIREGSRVIEAGTGSGALTSLLAHWIGATGTVFSYEKRPNVQERAYDHLKRLGLEQRVVLHQHDIGLGLHEKDVDAVFLDLPEPYLYVDIVREALYSGGFLGALVPTVNQMQLLLAKLYIGRWYLLQAEEIILRPWKSHPERIRPADEMMKHTGFLVFARAVGRD